MTLLSSMLLAALAMHPPARAAEPQVKVTIDSAKHEVVIVAGPYHLPNMPRMEHDGMMMMDHEMGHDEIVNRFDWPVDGWMRGFAWSVVDAKGQPIERRVMHHMIMVNFDRRQITYRAAERLMGAGSETEDVSIPKTIGVPMKKGMDLGMYIAWHNDTGKDLDGVYLKVKLLWMPTNQNPQPVNALPIYMDVNLTVGGSNTFDIPPGHSTKSWEFTLPTSGKILGLGGHMHDYGSSVRLEDVENGKVLARVAATRTPDGKVVKVSRKLFGVTGDGLTMKAGHKYRVVGEYDNPTKTTFVKGAMAHMSGIFSPDDMSKWPAVDPNDPLWKRDMASLEVQGKEPDHEHMKMDHGKMDHEHMEHGKSGTK